MFACITVHAVENVDVYSNLTRVGIRRLSQGIPGEQSEQALRGLDGLDNRHGKGDVVVIIKDDPTTTQV